ncbi:beta-1,4-endoglucanase [Colletotrichum chrysophilum]|uniref:Beta-1,4-endoglucanase n=1 Tax=Colletotrichum chrysophilum TaxID=1836956 RepID=A0AAD9A9B5_9PEZI|nr:hypothetical protein KNSL1_000484 [Colletotrichum chrysophilum]KAK1843848.1 beta-1,4-endoglucanase [Colletotrichum chrysophilum]
MAPSLVTIGTAALALAGDVAAKKFSLADTYDSTNFFSKFTFFESNYNTSNYNDVDPTSGYINYRSQADAQALGLASTAGGEIYLGLDAKSITQFPGVGRSSVRLESKEVYNKALIVARFSHLPKPVCGAWPAFWSYGSPWPTKGELDWFEGWNLNKVNKPAAHTYKSSEQGQCLISSTGQTAQVDTPNCDQEAPNQYSNQGCTTSTTSSDPYGSSDGGVYAVEWTDDYIKFFSWRWGSVPDNVNSDSPDTATWGTPSMLIANDACNINSHFKDQRLVINIGMCGVLAGNDGVWGSECKAATGHAVCSTYAATNPSAFSDTYFKVKDIRIFKEGGQTSSTVSSSASSTASSSASSSASASASASQSSSASASASSLSATDSASASATASASVSGSASAQASGSASSATASGSAAASGSAVASGSATASGSASSDIASASASASASSQASGSGSSAASVSSAAASASGSVTDAGTGPVSGTASAFSTITNNWNQTSVIPAPTPVVSSSSVVQLTTSTVFTTQVSTVTSCAPTVTNCPVGAVVTKTIALYTTVCPVTAAVKTTSAKGNGKASTKVNKSNTTKATTKVNKNTTKPTTKTTPPGVRTTVLTKTYTITKCPSSVPNCPIGSVTTKVTTKVITPTPKTTPKTTTKPANGGSNNKVSTKVYTTTYTITKCPASVPNCPIGSVTTKTVTKVTTPGVPATPKTTPATKVTKVITVSTTPAKTTGGSNTNKSNNSNNGGGSNTNKSNNGNTYSNSTTAVTKSSTVSSAKASGTAPGASTTVCSGASCPATTKPVITNNAVQAGVSFALMAVGAFAVFVL